MLKVLSTKSQDEDLVSTAGQMGIALDCIEVIRTQTIDFDIYVLRSDSYDAIVFTSSSAVRAVTPSLKRGPGGFDYQRKRVYSLSGKTQSELIKHNIVSIAVADNASQLADKIITDGNIRSVLHICGDLKLDVLENKLTASGISYKPLIVYETVPVSNEINGDYDAVMFYSPSGIESFLAKNNFNRDTLYCCIGETTAQKLRGIDESANIIIPNEPTPHAMLRAIKENKSK